MPSTNVQFFKPTGFEESFDSGVVEQLASLKTSHKGTIEEAVRHVDYTSDKQGAVSISLEPGSGKTTVFPFRFETSSVCVVLPTGFDSLCAFRLASAPANINTGKFKEDNGSNVTYMDSYTAGFLCFKHKGRLPFQIVIIDESDSNAGITKTLTEMKFPGSYTIHLSGTPEGREILSTSAFEVQMYNTLPELSDVYFEAVDFIKERSKTGRSLVMVPSSKVARHIHGMIKNSRIIDTECSVEELDSLVADQSKKQVIVADDSCTRGFNLNLDRVFDFQQTSAGEGRRNITKAEQMQRRMRVGRTKAGAYFYSPVEHSSDPFSKWDVFRHNVARAVFGLPLKSCELQVDKSRLHDLMVAQVEPYDLQLSLPSLVAPGSPVVEKRKDRRRSSAVSDKAPEWMLWVTGYKGKLKHSRSSSNSSTGSKAIASSSSSASSSSLRPENSVSVVGVATGKSSITTTHGTGFSASNTSRQLTKTGTSWTPTIDLATGGCEEWPDALRMAYEKGDKLCMVKPGSWVYTSHGGTVDYTQRLVNIIKDGPTFSEPEMEVVCRAWNVLVSRMNFSFSKGADAWGDNDRVGFILDYFSSYNNMMLS